MSRNMRDDIKVNGLILRRTNYGEADRILSLITTQGKLAAIAKGVRKERAKMAGSIELFTLVTFTIHNGKSQMGVVTGAKMLRHYGNIVKDLKKMELAANILKKISLAAEGSDSGEFFRIANESLAGMDDGVKEIVVESWFILNLMKATGEEVNIFRDVNGKKLEGGQKYDWDMMEKAFRADGGGEYGENEIKLMRLMVTNSLAMVNRVKGVEVVSEKILRLLESVVK